MILPLTNWPVHTAALLIRLLVYLSLQYGTFTYQEVAVCPASNSKLDGQTATLLKALTYIYRELCLHIPQLYRKRFSAVTRRAVTPLEGGAILEAAHSIQMRNNIEMEPSFQLWTQAESLWCPFVEQCRQGWLDIYALSALIAGRVFKDRLYTEFGMTPFT